MKFKHNWTYNTTEEMNDAFRGGKKELHDLIVDTALANLNTKRKQIPVVSIYTKDEDMIYDIMIDRVDMLETLEANLISMEEYEDYERCQQIFEAISYLKSK